jgi:hypothetical protein
MDFGMDVGEWSGGGRQPLRWVIGGPRRVGGRAVAGVGQADQQGLDLVRVEAEQTYAGAGRAGQRSVRGDRGGLDAGQPGRGAEQPEHQRLVCATGRRGQVGEWGVRPDGPAGSQQRPALSA